LRLGHIDLRLGHRHVRGARAGGLGAQVCLGRSQERLGLGQGRLRGGVARCTRQERGHPGPRVAHRLLGGGLVLRSHGVVERRQAGPGGLQRRVGVGEDGVRLLVRALRLAELRLHRL
jgi:hypothetical protein